MIKGKTYRAFTILEVTIVMVLISIITVFVYKGFSMFSQRLNSENALRQELDDFYLFRSSLYKDLVEAKDFVEIENGIEFIGTHNISYLVDDEVLIRQAENDNYRFKLKPIELRLKTEKETEFFFLSLDWKDEELQIKYPVQKDISSRINTYFDNYESAKN